MKSRSAFGARLRPLTAAHRSSDPPTSALPLGASFGNMAERTSLADGISQQRASRRSVSLPESRQPDRHMSHVVLLGDSTLDNASYTAGGPDVISQVRQLLPPGWKATLSAVDGSTTEDIPEQLESMPDDATHLILSIGGNNAILRADILEKPVASTGEAFHLLSAVAEEFEKQYRKALTTCLSRRLPLAACTIYHGNFEDEVFRRRAIVALTLFNDAIVRCAAEHQLLVIDLRFVCNAPLDFANPIEPSAIGGAKIARAIVTAVMEPSATKRRSQIATS